MASKGFIELLRLADLARARKSGRRSGQEYDWQGVVFEIGGQRLVAPMGQVSEVLAMPEYTSLPLVKPWMLGIANIRVVYYRSRICHSFYKYLAVWRK